VFHRGPLFSQVVLIDEVNRATAKTQSALLEAMEEHRISVDGMTYDLPVTVFCGRDTESATRSRHLSAPRIAA
jgi:MoxR-like ATPases